MTRKDFVVIAGALAEAHAEVKNFPALRRGVEIATEKVAAALLDTNARFNRGRFLAAARGEPINGRDKAR